jgi:hypothetical protein
MGELLSIRLHMLALGYRDQGGVDLLRPDPALRFAVSDSAGVTPLSESTLA